jgi:pilus assembly protein Flp/PilA
MVSRIGRLVRDQRGIAALEYALIAGLIFAAVISAGKLFGPQLSSSFSNIGSSILSRDLGT